MVVSINAIVKIDININETLTIDNKDLKFNLTREKLLDKNLYNTEVNTMNNEFNTILNKDSLTNVDLIKINQIQTKRQYYSRFEILVNPDKVILKEKKVKTNDELNVEKLKSQNEIIVITNQLNSSPYIAGYHVNRLMLHKAKVKQIDFLLNNT